MSVRATTSTTASPSHISPRTMFSAMKPMTSLTRTIGKGWWARPTWTSSAMGRETQLSCTSATTNRRRSTRCVCLLVPTRKRWSAPGRRRSAIQTVAEKGERSTMSSTLSEDYLRWLAPQIRDEQDGLSNPRREFWGLLELMYEKEFVTFVPNDHNRCVDGLDLRLEFTRETRTGR